MTNSAAISYLEPMAEKRLIEYWFIANKIEKLHMDAFRRQDKAQSGTYRKVEDILANAPTVDAVPVVRCRDCVNWHKDTLFCGYMPYGEAQEL